MASVFLDFVAPNDIPDLTSLHIYEGATPDGIFAEIEEVVAIGVQPNYISSYTTTYATNENGWFTIRWENSKGALTPYSDAVQGGTRSVVSEIVSRILLRDATISEQVAAEEAEAVVEQIYGLVNPDPSTVTRRRMSGMTLLAMARIQLGSLAVTSSGSQWTAGLVSMKSDNTSKNLDNVKGLLIEASRMLGISMSVVAQMIPLEIAGGLSEIVSADISRLQIEVE